MMRTHKKKRFGVACMRKKNGNYCVNEPETQEVWLEYVNELYGDSTRPSQVSCAANEVAPRIEIWELKNAIKKGRSHKATGEDQLPIDLIKHVTPEYEKELLIIMNKIYQEGKLPEDFKAVNFVPIPKKSTSQVCSEYRTIALMSHALKLLLAVINARIERKLDDNLSETQYGFVAKKGTRDAIALLKMVI